MQIDILHILVCHKALFRCSYFCIRFLSCKQSFAQTQKKKKSFALEKVNNMTQNGYICKFKIKSKI